MISDADTTLRFSRKRLCMVTCLAAFLLLNGHQSPGAENPVPQDHRLRISRPGEWRSLKLEVTIAPAFLEGEPIVVSVKVTNITDREVEVAWPKAYGTNVIWKLNDLDRKKTYCVAQNPGDYDRLPIGQSQKMGELLLSRLATTKLKPGESLESWQFLTDGNLQGNLATDDRVEFIPGRYELQGAYCPDPHVAARHLGIKVPYLQEDPQPLGNPVFETVISESHRFVIEKLPADQVLARVTEKVEPFQYRSELFLKGGDLYIRRFFIGTGEARPKPLPELEKPQITRLAQKFKKGSAAVLVSGGEFTDAVWQEGNSLKAARVSAKTVLFADVGTGQLVQAKHAQDGSLLVQLKKDGGAPQWQTVRFKSAP